MCPVMVMRVTKPKNVGVGSKESKSARYYAASDLVLLTNSASTAFRPMFIVAKRLHGSRCHLARR